MTTPNGAMSSPMSHHKSSILNVDQPEKTWTSLAQDLNKALERTCEAYEKSVEPPRKKQEAALPSEAPKFAKQEPKIEVKHAETQRPVEQPVFSVKNLSASDKNSLVQSLIKCGFSIVSVDDVEVKFSTDVDGKNETFSLRLA